MSGIYGKFLQSQKDGFGDRFNPVYGAEVETGCRLKVAEFVLKNKSEPIHIAVDGVILTEPAYLGSNEPKLGSWELVAAEPCICAGTGVVAIKGKKRSADFSMDYDQLVEQIEQNPEASEYKIEKLAPVTLAVALNGNWTELGRLRRIAKTIYIGDEAKRYYKESPKCGKDLLSKQYRSEPWDASLISTEAQWGKELK